MIDLQSLEGPLLLGLAAAAIRERLGADADAPGHRPWLDHPAASFVTLEWAGTGELHGCIGSIEPRRALGEDVRANAVLAAFEDPRSRHRLRPIELERLNLTVAVLGPLEPLPVVDHVDARARVRPDVDGLVLRWRHHRGVFLPKVWDKLPSRAEFLAGLWRKANLPVDFWAPDLELWRFEVRDWSASMGAIG